MTAEEYLALAQPEPTREEMSWALTQGACSREFLIYRAGRWTDPMTGISEKCVDARCTACQREMKLDYVPAGGCGRGYEPAPFGFRHPETGENVISGGNTLCPICGAPVEATHIGRIRYGIEQVENFVTVGRIGEAVAIYIWAVKRDITKEGGDRIKGLPEEAYIFERRKAVRLTGVERIMYSLSYTGHWSVRKVYKNVFGKVIPRWVKPWDAGLLKGSTLENSRIDRFLKNAGDNVSLMEYIRLWQKNSAVETLVEAGLSKLLEELLNFNREDKLNLKAKRPGEILQMNREEFRICREMRWNRKEWEAYVEWRTAEPVKLPQDMARYRADRNVHDLIYMPRHGLRVLRVADYLKRQRERDAKADLQMLRDTWRMMRIAGEPMTADRLLPKSLTREHDRLTERVNEIRIKELAEKKSREMAERAPLFEKRLQELERYAWEQDGLLIRPAANEAELIAEGVQQNHCVATYAAAMARGGTAIFFIRRTAEPEKSYYTLELDEKSLTVRQNRGRSNCARTDEVKAFEEAWLKWLKAGCIREEKKTA